jgi:hypothetical protein
LNLDKSEAIAVGRTSLAALAAHLPSALLTQPDGVSRVLRDFEFLGAAIGRPAFLEAHAASRVEAASKLLANFMILKSPCGCSGPQRALPAWCTPCGAALLQDTAKPSGNLTSSCKLVSALSAVCTLNLASGSRPPVA